MREADESELKAELDRISQRIESILKEIEEINPAQSNDNEKTEN